MPDFVNPMGDLAQKLIWVCRGEYTCPVCLACEGRVYTYDTWMSANVWPGMHYKCDCSLKPVGNDYEISDPDFFGTELNLLMQTMNPHIFFARFHWDPNYKPFADYLTEQIMEAHLRLGRDKPIGQIIKMMRNEFQGFFKRSNIWDNFFQWRVFATQRHYQNIDGTASGGDYHTKYGNTSSAHKPKPDSLKPYLPVQTYDKPSWYY